MPENEGAMPLLTGIGGAVDSSTPVAEAPLTRTFILGLTLAQVGAFVSFVPLLQILLPLKVAQIDPLTKDVTLAALLFCGAITAGIANLFAGSVSDRTTWRSGRRRPWMLMGVCGAIIGYVLIAIARSRLGLLVGLIVFQVAFNFFFAALLALVLDQVSPKQRGRISALLGMGYPLGSLLGITLIGGMIEGESSRLIALGLIVVVATVPFALLVRDAPVSAEETPQGKMGVFSSGFWVNPREHPDFAFAFGGRFLVGIGLSLMQSYMLFYLVDQIRFGAIFPGTRPEQGLTLLTWVSVCANVAAAVAGGFLSDRFRRRKVFVICGIVVASIAMVALGQARSWPLVIAEYGVYGLGTGLYFAVDIALIADVLPQKQNAGKDLGIINLSNTIPQVLAPMIALFLLGARHADFGLLFTVAAGVSLAGALMVMPIRNVS